MMRATLIGLLLCASAACAQDTPPMVPRYSADYNGGVQLSAYLLQGSFDTTNSPPMMVNKSEYTVIGATDGRFHDKLLKLRCTGRVACYGEVLHVYGAVNLPNGLVGDYARVDNGGADGYAIARKTAMRGNDEYGSWGHQININRGHAAIAIVGDHATDGTDRSYLGVWISESIDITDSAFRYNQKPGSAGWAVKMLAADGRIYGLDADGRLHVREVVVVP